MRVFLLFLCLTFCWGLEPGVQMRLTKNGMTYVVDVGIDILKTDILKDVINESGEAKGIKYDIQNMRVTRAEFGSYKLSPEKGTGMRGVVSGISVDASGKIHYEKKVWGVKIQDTIGLSVRIKDVAADLVVMLGANKGRPTVALKSCSAKVEDINLKFSGGGSWIYNIFSGIIEDKLKDIFGEMLCELTEKAIKEKAEKELQTFPITKRIDSHASIDYSLIKAPTFTDKYMDVYLRGKFFTTKEERVSPFDIADYYVDNESSKMVYFWLSEATINSAGQVYQDARVLKGEVNAWDDKVPSEIKSVLKTSTFALFVPGLKKYNGAPMGMDIISNKAPSVQITEDLMKLHLYPTIMFRVKTNDKVVDAFSVRFEIKSSAKVFVKQDNVTAKISTFDYDAKVEKSFVGNIPVGIFDSGFVRTLVDMAVVKKANAMLNKGFPLPKVDDVAIRDAEIKLIKDAIQVGSNLCYLKDDVARDLCHS